jgi:hypothetical protein
MLNENETLADDTRTACPYLIYKQTSDMYIHKHKVVIKTVEVKLTEKGKQHSVPFETKMATT